MSEELHLAFEHIAERGKPAGAQRVAANAMRAAGIDILPGPRRHRFVAVAAAMAVLAVGVAGVAAVRSRVPPIERVDVGDSLVGGDGRRDVMTALVVGSDSRVGLDDPRRRADAIMLIRVDRAAGALSVLSLPRDLYVPIAGTGSSDRLSAASVAGPGALVDTVRALTGMTLDHYVEFDFTGFKRVVDAAGGIDLLLPARMRDELTGLDLPAGCNHLDGATALAYAQSRHVSTQASPDASFTIDATGDIGRIGRQQLLFVLALDQLTRTHGVARIKGVLDAVAKSVRVDHGLSLRDGVDFAKDWRRLQGPRALLTYPQRPGRLANGAVVLHPDTAQAAAVMNTFTHPVDEPRSTPPEGSCLRPQPSTQRAAQQLAPEAVG